MSRYSYGRYDRLRLRVDSEIPGVKVIRHEESYFLRTLHFLLRLLSLGKFDPSNFTTTIGKRMYVPNEWYSGFTDEQRYSILRHELVHMRQFRQWPMKFLDLPVLRTVNFLVFSFCYLLVFPARWTLRSRFEQEAYTQTLLVHYEIHGEYTLRAAQQFVMGMGEQFGGPNYFFMWNNSEARKWAAKTMDDIEAGKITNDLDRVDLEQE